MSGIAKLFIFGMAMVTAQAYTVYSPQILPAAQVITAPAASISSASSSFGATSAVSASNVGNFATSLYNPTILPYPLPEYPVVDPVYGYAGYPYGGYPYNPYYNSYNSYSPYYNYNSVNKNAVSNNNVLISN